MHAVRYYIEAEAGARCTRPDWKVIRYSTGEPKQTADWQLFNLKDDPKEKDNVAASHPEILGQLHARFLKQRAMDLK